VVQHRVVARPNEATHQGHHRHVATTRDYAGLRPKGRCVPRRSAAEVCSERKPPSRITRAQGPGKDQVGPGRRPHAHTSGAQVRAMAIVQGSQGGRQLPLLAPN
jgi:hypothetical protein